jgi:pantetheine-phosphate adenylyltransferase
MPGKTYLYCGSFDPVTLGHEDVIRRAAKQCGRLVVAVLHNTAKKPFFPVDARVGLLREVCKGLPNVEVVSFDGLMKDLVVREGADAIVRGVRNVADFEYGMASFPYFDDAAPGCETLLFPSRPALVHISSSLVREHLRLGGTVDGLVPDAVSRRIVELHQEMKGA